MKVHLQRCDGKGHEGLTEMVVMMKKVMKMKGA